MYDEKRNSSASLEKGLGVASADKSSVDKGLGIDATTHAAGEHFLLLLLRACAYAEDVCMLTLNV